MREIAALDKLHSSIKFMNGSGHGARHPGCGKQGKQFKNKKGYGDNPERLAPNRSSFACAEKLFLGQHRCPVEDEALVLFALARRPVSRRQHNRIIDSTLFQSIAELVNFRHVLGESNIIFIITISTRRAGSSSIFIQINPDLPANSSERRSDEEWADVDSGRLTKTIDESFVYRNDEQQSERAIIDSAAHKGAH